MVKGRTALEGSIGCIAWTIKRYLRHSFLFDAARPTGLSDLAKHHQKLPYILDSEDDYLQWSSQTTASTFTSEKLWCSEFIGASHSVTKGIEVRGARSHWDDDGSIVVCTRVKGRITAQWFEIVYMPRCLL